MSSTLPPAPTALAALTTPDLEATIRKILSETRPASHKRPEYTQQEKDAYHHARFNGNLDTNKRYQSQEGKWTVLDERGYEYVVELQKEKRVLVKVRDLKAS